MIFKAVFSVFYSSASALIGRWPMKDIRELKFQAGSREELLPGFAPEFPCIASRVELDCYPGRCAPWHWHRAAELFYVENGSIEYHTPGGSLTFSEGSGGYVNSNVLHMTKAAPGTVQLLHIFDPALLSGEQDSRIGRRYIAPLTASPVELLPLFPEDAAQAELLALLLNSFHLAEDSFGYELRLRGALSGLWLGLLGQAQPMLEGKLAHSRTSGQIKQMMAYIHERYAERITVSELAASAFLSERECYRAFRNCLHTTPVEYMTSFRLQAACRMLEQGQEPITGIGRACGLGSSSYFGRVFRERVGCTPSEYRRKWQNHDN